MTEEKGNILIVDDEKAIRRLLHERLEGEGYRCQEAGSADQALDKMQAEPADLVLIDIKMPDKSGIELLQEIKGHYPDAIAVTATDIQDNDIAIESIRQGAYDYITKPFNLDVVVQMAKRVMDQKELKLELRDYQQHLEQKLIKQAEEIHQTFLGTMQALIFAVEATDRYTAGHSRRVCEIAKSIAKRLAFSDNEMEDLRWGSLLHDIGKIAVDQSIMNKPGKLTTAEYEHIMAHTIIGASIIQSVVKNNNIIDIIEHHHDHYNGNGFNQNVKGEDIPLLARIVAIADAYDAMTSTRPYRAALPREEALAEIEKEIGKQFDPLAANTFLKMSASEIIPEKKHILIADDEPSIRLLVRSILSGSYTIIEVANGQDAVKAAQKHHPDLVLMDILMPNKDGLQALYEIKTNSATRSIPVVILTGVNRESDRRVSAGIGADYYLTKPFSPKELMAIIDKILIISE